MWVESGRQEERGNVCRGRSPARGGHKGDDRGTIINTAATALGLGEQSREREREREDLVWQERSLDEVVW